MEDLSFSLHTLLLIPSYILCSYTADPLNRSRRRIFKESKKQKGRVYNMVHKLLAKPPRPRVQGDFRCVEYKSVERRKGRRNSHGPSPALAFCYCRHDVEAYTNNLYLTIQRSPRHS
ncbi:hypothetical protein F4861DRAFT_190262 [Xylaria intraflava]|nr:hypothetical protein F4861DRAFT_190262 [Xylaria intraflava]